MKAQPIGDRRGIRMRSRREGDLRIGPIAVGSEQVCAAAVHAKPVSTSVATPLTSIDGETPGARVTVSAMVPVGATAGSLSVTVVALLTVDVPKALLSPHYAAL